MRKQFRPEFLNRIDATIFFRKLTEDDVRAIARLQLNQLINQLHGNNKILTIDDTVVTYIAQEGYEPEFGARPLKRAIARYITVPLSQYILQQPTAAIIHISMHNNAITIK